MDKTKRKREGCVFSGCERPHEARGFCRFHYRPAAKAFKSGAGSWEWLAENPEKIEAGDPAGGNGNGRCPEPAPKPEKIENPVPVSISLLKPGSLFMLNGKIGRLEYVNGCCAAVELRNGRIDRYGREDRRCIKISPESEVLVEEKSVRQFSRMERIRPEEFAPDARRLYEAMRRMFPKAYGE